MDPDLPQYPAQYRALQPQTAQVLQHSNQHLAHHALTSQTTGLDLSLDDDHSVYQELNRIHDSHGFQNAPNPFDRGHIHPPLHDHTPLHDGHTLHDNHPVLHDSHPHLPDSHAPLHDNQSSLQDGHSQIHVQNNGSPLPHTPQNNNGGGQFGMLTAGPIQHNAIGRLQEEELFGSSPPVPEGSDQHSLGHQSTRLVDNPPSLPEWRQRLFDVNEMITLSEDEYMTYFPHVDNVYSHRSTQKYKKKPFVSHYWDCRLKGRPPGTPKSDDPNKKKRKRTARERDLCDVKIKITEYFPENGLFTSSNAFDTEGGGPVQPPAANGFGGNSQTAQGSQFGVSVVNPAHPAGHPGANGQRFYTIQRVNGNGGNGKGDGVPGPHKHDLAESDRVKKNSVQRMMLKKDKEEKKQQKTYHKKATGTALLTVRKHAKEAEYKLYGSCHCPFVQRVWIALEAKGLPYQYIEVDQSKKPQALLDINATGLVPALLHGNFRVTDSTVLLEYLEEMTFGNQVPFLPGGAQERAVARQWSVHINTNIIPAFYTLLQNQDFLKQPELTKILQDEIQTLVHNSDPQGPYFGGPFLSLVDVQFAPWMLRLSRVLKHYRSWQDPVPGTRWATWMEAIETNEHIRNTTSSDELYIDSYEPYAHNRTAHGLADIINGKLTITLPQS